MAPSTSAPESARTTPGACRAFDKSTRTDLRVRIGTAQERGVVHAGKLQIVDVVADPLDQPRVFLALERLADESRGHGDLPNRGIAPMLQRLRALIFLAAYCTASTMCWYPVQRQRLPESALRISASLGLLFRCSRSTAARIIPGVQ